MELHMSQEDSSGAVPQEEITKIVSENRDDLEHFHQLVEMSHTAEGLPSLVAKINNSIDRESQAIYVEIPTESRAWLYEFNTETQEWQQWYQLASSGPVRPFIGDTLVITTNDQLLVADTARCIAIDQYHYLGIREKTDPAVQHYAGEQAVETLKKVGAKAMETGDKSAYLTPGRWGQEASIPSIED
jgi:hypothetical protein